MSAGFEMPRHDDLLAEQALVQAEKFQSRLLGEYSSYLFPGQQDREPGTSAVVDFVRPIIGKTERVTLDGVLEGLLAAAPEQSIHWVDMGGGRALPMRQCGSRVDFGQKLKMTNVDLFHTGLEGLTQSELDYLEGIAPGMTALDAEPTVIADNIETVRLPEPATIITSVEAMQYLNNPLGALANWYNQLADDGVMFVSAGHDWTSWMRYNREPESADWAETPTKQLLDELSRAGIHHAATTESDWPNGVRPLVDPENIRTLALQKKPGTFLRVTQPVARVWVNPYHFKAVYYETPTDEDTSIIEVIHADTATAMGAVASRHLR